MKKAIYYATPILVLPILFSVFSWLDGMGISSDVARAFVCIALISFSALMGSLSPTNKKFDYIMTAILPLSVFFTLFIALYFDKGCDGMPQLSIHHALNVEYYKSWAPTVAVMTATAFIASFQPIRILSKLRRKTVK